MSGGDYEGTVRLLLSTHRRMLKYTSFWAPLCVRAGWGPFFHSRHCSALVFVNGPWAPLPARHHHTMVFILEVVLRGAGVTKSCCQRSCCTPILLPWCLTLCCACTNRHQTRHPNVKWNAHGLDITHASTNVAEPKPSWKVTRPCMHLHCHCNLAQELGQQGCKQWGSPGTFLPN